MTGPDCEHDYDMPPKEDCEKCEKPEWKCICEIDANGNENYD